MIRISPVLDPDWDEIFVPPITLQTAYETWDLVLNRWHQPHVSMEFRWLIKKEASEYQGISNPMLIPAKLEITPEIKRMHIKSIKMRRHTPRKMNPNSGYKRIWHRPWVTEIKGVWQQRLLEMYHEMEKTCS